MTMVIRKVTTTKMMMMMAIVFSVPSMVGGKHPGTGHKSSLCGTALKKWIKTDAIEKREENKAIIRKVNKLVKPTHMTCKRNINDLWNILNNTEWKFCVLSTRYVQHTPCTWYWNGKRMGSSANATQDLGNKSMPTSSWYFSLSYVLFDSTHALIEGIAWFHLTCSTFWYLLLKFCSSRTHWPR